MTNGDRIRQMTDEELARLFYTLRFGGYGTGNEIINALEESRTIKWLKKDQKGKKKMSICNNCRHATCDCCEYFGGYKEWFVDGCELQTPRSEENEKGEVIACEDYEDSDGGPE